MILNIAQLSTFLVKWFNHIMMSLLLSYVINTTLGQIFLLVDLRTLLL